jgi:hypothetical protein
MILNIDVSNRVPYWPLEDYDTLQPHWFHACTLDPVLRLVNRLISLTRQVRVKRELDALFSSALILSTDRNGRRCSDWNEPGAKGA